MLGAGALTNESRRILARQAAKRDEIKHSMLLQRQAAAKRRQQGRLHQVDRWRRKTGKSPFAVDLLAEHEKLGEFRPVRRDCGHGDAVCR
jgi:hypothetical protein